MYPQQMDLDDIIFQENLTLNKIQELEDILKKKDVNILKLKKKIIATSSLLELYRVTKNECEELKKTNFNLTTKLNDLTIECKELLLRKISNEENIKSNKSNYDSLLKKYNDVVAQDNAKKATIKQMKSYTSELKDRLNGIVVESEMIKSKLKEDNDNLKAQVRLIKDKNKKESKLLSKIFSNVSTLRKQMKGKQSKIPSETLKILIKELSLLKCHWNYYNNHKLLREDLGEMLEDECPFNSPASVDTGKGSSVYTSGDEEKSSSVPTTPTREDICSSGDSFYPLVSCDSIDDYTIENRYISVSTSPIKLISVCEDNLSVAKCHVATSPIKLPRSSESTDGNDIRIKTTSMCLNETNSLSDSDVMLMLKKMTERFNLISPLPEPNNTSQHKSDECKESGDQLKNSTKNNSNINKRKYISKRSILPMIKEIVKLELKDIFRYEFKKYLSKDERVSALKNGKMLSKNNLKTAIKSKTRLSGNIEKRKTSSMMHTKSNSISSLRISSSNLVRKIITSTYKSKKNHVKSVRNDKKIVCDKNLDVEANETSLLENVNNKETVHKNKYDGEALQKCHLPNNKNLLDNLRVEPNMKYPAISDNCQKKGDKAHQFDTENEKKKVEAKEILQKYKLRRTTTNNKSTVKLRVGSRLKCTLLRRNSQAGVDNDEQQYNLRNTKSKDKLITKSKAGLVCLTALKNKGLPLESEVEFPGFEKQKELLSVNEDFIEPINQNKINEVYRNENNVDISKQMVADVTDNEIFRSLILKLSPSLKKKRIIQHNVPSELCVVMENFLTTEFSNKNLESFVESIKEETGENIASALVEFLCSSNRYNDATNHHYPIMPMTRSHQAVLVLIHNLPSSTVNMVELVMRGIEYKMFKLNATPELQSLQNLTAFYVALCRLQKQKDRLKIFCLDALYCLSYSAAPVIYLVLMCWPAVFPKSHYPNAKDPLFITMVHYLLSNFSEFPQYNSKLLQQLLHKQYGYKTGEYTDNEILNLLLRLIKGKEYKEKSLLSAFLLLGKRTGVEWCYDTIIIKSLIPIIDDNQAEVSSKAMAIKLIGPLTRPLSNKTLQCGVILKKLISLFGTTGVQDIDEAIIHSISHFKKKPLQYLNRLLEWKPLHPVSEDCQEILTSIINEHPKNFWLNRMKRKV